MVAKSKIVDQQEVLRWFREQRPYPYMIEQYRTKYNVETTTQMWSEFRSRHGLPKRQSQDNSLLPWRLEPHHRFDRTAVLLRFETRRRAGKELAENHARQLTEWLAKLEKDQLVVDYDPTAPKGEGFKLVPREPGDADIVRRPTTDTGKRADERAEPKAI